MKPILPVSQDWILRIIDVQNVSQLFTPYVGIDDFDHQYLGKHIEMLGMFGHFITIRFNGNYFLVPSKLVQYVIWSFEKNLSAQFSDEDLLSICGTSNRGNVLHNLQKEMGALFKTFNNKSHDNHQIKAKLDQSIDEFIASTMDFEPPAYLFDEISHEVRL